MSGFIGLTPHTASQVKQLIREFLLSHRNEKPGRNRTATVTRENAYVVCGEMIDTYPMYGGTVELFFADQREWEEKSDDCYLLEANGRPLVKGERYLALRFGQFGDFASTDSSSSDDGSEFETDDRKPVYVCFADTQQIVEIHSSLGPRHGLESSSSSSDSCPMPSSSGDDSLCVPPIFLGQIQAWDVECKVWLDIGCAIVFELNGRTLEIGRRYFCRPEGKQPADLEGAPTDIDADCQGILPLMIVDIGKDPRTVRIIEKVHGIGCEEVRPLYKAVAERFDAENCSWRFIEDCYVHNLSEGIRLEPDQRLIGQYEAMMPDEGSSSSSDGSDGSSDSGDSQSCKALYLVDHCCGLPESDDSSSSGDSSDSSSDSSSSGEATNCCDGRVLPDVFYANSTPLYKTTCSDLTPCCPPDSHVVWFGTMTISTETEACDIDIRFFCAASSLESGCSGFGLCWKCHDGGTWAPASYSEGSPCDCGPPIYIDGWDIDPTGCGTCTTLIHVVITE